MHWPKRWGFIVIIASVVLLNIGTFILLALGLIWNKTATVLVTGFGSIGTLTAASVALWAAQFAQEREEAARREAENQAEIVRNETREREDRIQAETVKREERVRNDTREREDRIRRETDNFQAKLRQEARNREEKLRHDTVKPQLQVRFYWNRIRSDGPGNFVVSVENWGLQTAVRFTLTLIPKNGEAKALWLKHKEHEMINVPVAIQQPYVDPFIFHLSDHAIDHGTFWRLQCQYGDVLGWSFRSHVDLSLGGGEGISFDDDSYIPAGNEHTWKAVEMSE